MRVPERPSWVAHHPFSAKTGDLRKRRYFLAVFLSRYNPAPARPSCTSTAKLGPCLNSCVGEVLVTVARDDRQSCCRDTARTGPWHCTGSRSDWHIGSKRPVPHLAQLHIWHSTHRQASELSQTQLPPGHPCSQPQATKKVLRGTQV